jgi:two-component system sensor histidine kinase DesK
VAVASSEAPARAADGERVLRRIRRYTTVTGCVIAGSATALVAFGNVSPGTLTVTLVAGILATWFAAYWERIAPAWLTAASVGVGAAAWGVTLALRESPLNVIPFAIALSMLVSKAAGSRARAALLAAAALLIPVATAAVLAPVLPWWDYGVLGIVVFGAWLLGFGLNRYVWNLSVELDAARRSSAELAIAQERYRFAADLHDIQGHTLHVLRLKLELVQRTLQSDPEAARAHAREAQELVAETLAGTRGLAFGDRQVTLSRELANAEALFAAAGISCTVDGDRAQSPQGELFALVVREATTNILRHSQARSVAVSLTSTSVSIENDGAPAAAGSLSGLARLGERFEAAGGTLRTFLRSGTFVTEAEKR